MLLEKLLISVVHHTLVLTSIRTTVTREIIIITCAYSADQCIRPLNGPTRFNELPLETDVYRKKKQNKTKYILKSAYLRIKSNGHFIIKTNDLSFESSSVHFEAGNTERNTERTTETSVFVRRFNFYRAVSISFHRENRGDKDRDLSLLMRHASGFV